MRQRKRFATFSALAIGVCIFLQGAALAQINTGRVSGTVTDNSGAVVPGAAVSVINDETHLVAKATTDNSGYYLVVNLPSGRVQRHRGIERLPQSLAHRHRLG
jgi:Carboxypeptidase regulatory-like domain